MEVTISPVAVMYVEAPDGPAGSGEAFARLEARFVSLKSRKFYGTFQVSSGVYRACVAIEPGDNPQALGLDTWTIPGGLYARRKLDDWTEHADEIPDVFGQMVQEYRPRLAQDERPSIEFYKSQQELILLLPIQ